MSQILHEMNAATAPFHAKTKPARQISNYFSLLATMMKLGLQLIWERQNGLKHFNGIMDTPQTRDLYDDIIRCVMRPEEEESRHFSPQEIDSIAEVLAKRSMTTVKALGYLKVVIAVKIDHEMLENDGGEPHAIPGWAAPMADNGMRLEFRDHG